MKKIFSLPVLVLYFIALHSSCNKDNLPGAGEGRLVKVVGTGGDSVGITQFQYNERGHLSAISETINTVPVSITKFTYNAEGILEKSEYKYLQTGQTRNDVYFYQADKIIKKISKENNGDLTTTVYAYNLQGKLVADTVYDEQMLPSFYTSFQFDMKGNLVHWQSFTKPGSSPGWFSFGDNTAVYGSNPNPYNDFGLLYYICQGDPKGLSRSVMQKLTMPFGISEQYSYSYYPNGLPSKMLVDFGSPVKITLKFYYM